MTDAVGGFVKGAVDFVVHGLHHLVVLLVLGYCKPREMEGGERTVSPLPYTHLIKSCSCPIARVDQAAVLRYIPAGQGAQRSERTYPPGTSLSTAASNSAWSMKPCPLVSTPLKISWAFSF